MTVLSVKEEYAAAVHRTPHADLWGLPSLAVLPYSLWPALSEAAHGTCVTLSCLSGSV